METNQTELEEAKALVKNLYRYSRQDLLEVLEKLTKRQLELLIDNITVELIQKSMKRWSNIGTENETKVINDALSLIPHVKVLDLLSSPIITMFLKKRPIESLIQTFSYHNIRNLASHPNIVYLIKSFVNKVPVELLEKIFELDDQQFKKILKVYRDINNSNVSNSHCLLELLPALFPTVLENCKKFIKDKSEDADVYLVLALFLSPEDQIMIDNLIFTQEKLLLHAIQFNPKLSYAYSLLGKSMGENIKLLDGSIITKKQVYLLANHFDPEDVDPYIALAETLKSKTDEIELLNGTKYTKLDLLIKAYKICPTNPLTILKLSEVLSSVEEKQLGLTKRELLLKGIQLNCNYPSFYYHLIKLLGDSEKKITLLDGTTKTREELIDDFFNCLKESSRCVIVDPEDYKIKECLGKGSFGTVNKAFWKVTNKHVAIKTFEKDLCYHIEYNKEVQIMLRLRKEHFVQIFGVVKNSDSSCLVTELMSHTLFDEIKKDINMSLIRRIEVIKEITEALIFLDEKNLVHRDLKPQNILISFDGNIKIADFGHAKLIHQTSDNLKHYGTYGYVAPEISKRLEVKVTVKADVFSLGVIIIELDTKKHPEPISDIEFDSSNGHYRHKCYPEEHLRENDLKKMNNDLLKFLATWCIINDPNDRPSPKEIKKYLDDIPSPVIKFLTNYQKNKIL